MLQQTKEKYIGSLFSTFEEQLNHQHPLYILSHQIKWSIFESAFKNHYSGQK